MFNDKRLKRLESVETSLKWEKRYHNSQTKVGQKISQLTNETFYSNHFSSRQNARIELIMLINLQCNYILIRPIFGS